MVNTMAEPNENTKKKNFNDFLWPRENYQLNFENENVRITEDNW